MTPIIADKPVMFSFTPIRKRNTKNRHPHLILNQIYLSKDFETRIIQVSSSSRTLGRGQWLFKHWKNSPILALINYWIKISTGRRRGTEEFIGKACGSNLVAFWFHHYFVVHGQFSCLPYSLTFRHPCRIFRWPVQTIQDSVRSP